MKTTFLILLFFTSTHLFSQINLPLIIAEAPSERYKEWGKGPVADGFGPELWTWHSIMCFGAYAENMMASSTLSPQGKFSYDLKNLSDDNPLTAWVEGHSDYGIGEFIDFGDWMPIGNYSIGILNGYQQSKSAWEANSRVKKLKITLGGTDVCIVELSDVMGVQYINFPEEIVGLFRGQEFTVNTFSEVPPGMPAINDGNGKITYWVKNGPLRFTILDVYPGSKWKDTAISGIFSCGG